MIQQYCQEYEEHNKDHDREKHCDSLIFRFYEEKPSCCVYHNNVKYKPTVKEVYNFVLIWFEVNKQ